MIRDDLVHMIASEMFINGIDLETACFIFGIDSDYLSDEEIAHVYEQLDDMVWDWP